MDTARLTSALIRMFWTIIFPLIGGGVVYLLEPGRLEEVGVTNATAVLLIGGLLYGVKKLVWPDTRF